MGNPFMIVLAVVCVLGVLAACYAIWFVWDEGSPGMAAVFALMLVALLATVGAVWWNDTHADDGSRTHRWKGGDGPDTECYYSVQQGQPAHMVGKVMVPATGDEVYTECREHAEVPR